MTPRREQLSRTPRLTIFQSYGAILQSSFGIIIPNVLAFNASPPVSVLGTVSARPHFLRQNLRAQGLAHQCTALKTVDGTSHSSIQTVVLCCKLSKRPYHLFKDYLNITKPGVMTTVVCTLLFVTYISIGETTLTFPNSLTALGF